MSEPDTFDDEFSYRGFARKVLSERRFVLEPDQERFLSAVRSSCKQHEMTIDSGIHFWRAQEGYCWEADQELRVPYSEKRMLPLRDKASEGRANPIGIPVLYAALNKETAMSEVRPWIGAYVSVAALEILRPLRAIDCTGVAHEHAEYGFLTLRLDRDPTEEEVAKAVWIDIDAAFAEPVTRSDDVAEYAPTQILAELFRSEGYDGVVYQSHFGGETGYNVALFDLACVKVATIHLYKVTTAKFCFDKEYP